MNDEVHMGRSWVGTRMEDDCPCPKADCGLVIGDGINNKGCPQHDFVETKTMRQMHHAEDCPGEL